MFTRTKRALFYFALFLHCIIRAQPDLINNPSFEDLFADDTCCAGNVFGLFHQSNWIDPGGPGGSTDIFNSCANNLPFGDTWSIPHNKWGTQYPRTGDGYVSLQNYYDEFTWVQYVSSKLNAALNPNRTYCVTFYLSLGDTCTTYCNNFGAYFSDSLPTTNELLQFNLQAQVENDIVNHPLFDKVNWMEVKGSFVANGGEQYITLGNFKDIFNSDTVNIYNDTVWFHDGESGMYLDDVSVIELRALQSQDTTVCPQANFTQQLQAYTGYNTYLWSTGDTTTNIQINAPGLYWVTATNWCGSVTDTIEVKVFDTLALQNPLDSNFALCAAQFPYRLRPIAGLENYFTQFQWSNSLIDTNFTDVLLPGTYTLNAQHLCGTVTDSITITLNPTPQFTLGADTALCIGQSIALSGPPNMQYQWSTGESVQSITVNQSGNYMLIVTNAYDCSSSDEIQISFEQATALLLPDDASYYADEMPVKITVLNGFSQLLWSDGSTSNSIEVNEAGLYWVQGKDALGCLVNDSINIRIKERQIQIPGIVYNGQALIIKDLPPGSSILVFDAVGQLVFAQDNYLNDWQADVGSAVYYVQLLSSGNETLTGKVTVLK